MGVEGAGGFVAMSEEEKSVVVVAFVPWKVVAKSEVVVALVVVALRPVKFWSVVEAKDMRPPQNWDAAVVDVATR